MGFQSAAPRRELARATLERMKSKPDIKTLHRICCQWPDVNVKWCLEPDYRSYPHYIRSYAHALRRSLQEIASDVAHIGTYHAD